MEGSIDPRCEKIRGTHWPVKVAAVFGTRIAEAILASGLPTASKGRTYGCKRSDQTIKNSCGTGAVHIWVPAFAGTTKDNLKAAPSAPLFICEPGPPYLCMGSFSRFLSTPDFRLEIRDPGLA